MRGEDAGRVSMAGVLWGTQPPGEWVAGAVGGEELAIGDEDVVAEVGADPGDGEGDGGILIAEGWGEELGNIDEDDGEENGGCEESGKGNVGAMEQEEEPLSEALPALKGDGQPGEE